MPLSLERAENVLAACRTNALAASEALSTGLGKPFEIDSGKIESFQFQGAPAEWNGPGLLLVFKVGKQGLVACVPAASGLLPDWVANADAGSQDRLKRLALSFGAALLSGALVVDDATAVFVPNLAEAVADLNLAESVSAIHMLVRSGEVAGAIRLVWPAQIPESKASGQASHGKPVANASPPSANAAASEPPQLPTYVRSLLRISVPVSVQLASTKQPVSRVLNIGPGSIIQFDKNCEQPLTLYVGNQAVAQGEAVKVGEKFGVRITNMILPGERFFALRGKRSTP
jgi:flagellar motor switch protein FliN